MLEPGDVLDNALPLSSPVAPTRINWVVELFQLSAVPNRDIFSGAFQQAAMKHIVSHGAAYERPSVVTDDFIRTPASSVTVDEAWDRLKRLPLLIDSSLTSIFLTTLAYL